MTVPRRAAVAMLGGLGGGLRRRGDQAYSPPAAAATVGSRNVFRGRLVVIFGSAADGSVGLFVYSGPPAPGNLIYSVTAVAGTDNKGNHYLAGATSYSAAGITNQNGGVTLTYAGTPAAAGNLIASAAPAAGTDSFGNAYLAGVASYSPSLLGLNYAVQILTNAVTWYTGPSASNGAGPWTSRGAVAPDISGTQLQVSGFSSGLAPLVPIVAASLTGGTNVGSSAPPTTSADLEIHSLTAIAARTAPGTPPAGFGYLYVNSSDGSLHYKGHSGTDTMIAPG